MSLRSFSKLLASLSFFACTSLFAAPITVGVDNAQSVGEFGDPANMVFNLFVGANATITGISYNVNLTAYDPSTLGEIGLAVTDSAVENGVLFTPAMGVLSSGTGEYAGIVNLDGSFSVGSDGILHFEFFETVDNVAGSDGQWNSGTITFEVVQAPVTPAVPEPATVLLMAAGLAMMAYAARRRAS